MMLFHNKEIRFLFQMNEIMFSEWKFFMIIEYRYLNILYIKKKSIVFAQF